MTPLEEAVARIIDPGAFDGSVRVTEKFTRFEQDKTIDKARAILALPEIVKMQEALEQAIELCDIATDWNLDEVEIRGVMTATLTLRDSFRAALQPLKKEAE